MWACFIVTFIAAGRLLPSLIGKLSVKIGEISYSMYLIHFAILTIIIKNGFYVRFTGNAYYDALITTLLVALPVIIAISLLTYHVIKLPFLRLQPRYIVHSDEAKKEDPPSRS
jgi:peptidoglycan/LPS O-acetylase OafA/YrhL